MTSSSSIDHRSIRRIEGLLGWWGMHDLLELTGAEAAEVAPSALLLRLIKLSNEALAFQARELAEAGEVVALSLPSLAGTRQVSQFTLDQLNLALAATEALACHAQAWAEATRVLRDCCANLAGEAEGSVPRPVDSDALNERVNHVTRRVHRPSKTSRACAKPEGSHDQADLARGHR